MATKRGTQLQELWTLKIFSYLIDQCNVIMTQVSRLSHGSFSQYYFYGILQWIINNLSMCGNFPLHYLDNCTYKTTGSTWCYCRVIVFMYHNCYEMLPIRQGTEVYDRNYGIPFSCRACSLAMTWMWVCSSPIFVT